MEMPPLSPNIPPDPIKILVTGFGPFQKAPRNISQDTLALLEEKFPGAVIVTAVLTPEYRKAEAELNALIAREKPDFILALGEGHTNEKPKLTLESCAYSRSTHPDEVNETIGTLYPDREEEWVSVLNPELNVLIGLKAHQEGVPNRDILRDTDLTQFVCNAVYYQALTTQAAAGKPGQALFIHLDSPQDRNSISGMGQNQQMAQTYAAILNQTLAHLAAHPELIKQGTYQRGNEAIAKQMAQDGNTYQFQPYPITLAARTKDTPTLGAFIPIAQTLTHQEPLEPLRPTGFGAIPPLPPQVELAEPDAHELLVPCVPRIPQATSRDR